MGYGRFERIVRKSRMGVAHVLVFLEGLSDLVVQCVQKNAKEFLLVCLYFIDERN